MPKDPRSVTERKAEQIMVNKIMETASKQTRCAHCDEAIGYYSLAGVTIRDDDLTWCDTVCHDDWMDAADAAQKVTDESISEFGASVAQAAAEKLDEQIMGEAIERRRAVISMSNSIKFGLKQIRLGLTELFETAIDIYKFYSAQTEQRPTLSPQAQSVKARQGPTTVRPEFTVDYDEERNHKVQVNYSLCPGYTMEIHFCGDIQSIELDEAAALADEIKAALEAVERHKDAARFLEHAAETATDFITPDELTADYDKENKNAV